MAGKMNVQVAIADDYLADVPSVVERLSAAGMNVERTMPSIGAVTGSINDEAIETLRGVEGVAAVEGSREVGVPPADSEIQ